MHAECRYCDTGFRPVKYERDLICEGCGAEWNLVMVEDEPIDDDFDGEE